MSQPAIGIGELVHGFASHIRELKSSATKEATIRQNYIDPFWRALGWDVGDGMQRGPAECEVIIEKSVETAEPSGLRNRRPDYLFRVGGFPRFILEAKKPFIDLDTDHDAIFQAKQYAWNSTIPFAILTDFEQFRLYDTTLKPILHEPQRGLVRDFSLDYDSYQPKWSVILDTFGRAAVEGGSLERLFAQIKKVRTGRRIRTVDRMLFDVKGVEPVDEVFLAYLDVHRRQLAHEIYSHNKTAFPEAQTVHGAARLTEAVQRIMDRLVFMRVIEDRGIVPYGALRDMLDRVRGEGGDFYTALCATFREYDQKYNGYLYKPSFCEQLTVEGNVLADFVRTLYPPDGPWDFAAIGDDILGIVYERFLGNVVTVRHSQATIEEKPEVRHAGGVYYTPRFVVDSIIRRVVGPKITGKAPVEVLDVKILDPACGSGSFLVAALQYLFDYCLSAVVRDNSLAKAHVPALTGSKGRKKKSEIAFQDKDGRWYLAPDFRAALLTQCIHGVDIDRQAVEVTVMSLYLKMLESKLPENWATLWVERQLLPTLDNNIMCGNSLIDEKDYFAFRDKSDRNQLSLNYGEDEDTQFRINRFDWTSQTRGFGRLLAPQTAEEKARAGFDCIIGNPPYIRVQELNQWAPEECKFYKWKYTSAAKGNYDIYVVFTEKALSLLSPRGRLGFIMPHKWWQAQYGEALRDLIADGKHLEEVVDFGDQQVFKGATTYTAIHVLSRDASKNDIDYAKVVELNDGRAQCSDLDAGRSVADTQRFEARRPKAGEPWVFTNATDTAWLNAVRGDHKTLGEITSKIAQGLVSGCDPVFYVEKRGREYYSEHTGRPHAIEQGLLHPLLKGSVHIRRWAFDRKSLSVLFPYHLVNGDWKLIPPSEMKAEYPLAHAYLSECRAKLEDREKKERKDEAGNVRYDRPFAGAEFYRFSRPQNFEVMPCAKLLVPAMGQRAEYAIDETGEYYFVGSGGGGGGAYAIIPSIDIDLHYLCGLLNSRCLDAFLQRVTTPFHSGWFAYSKAYIAQIPVKIPKTPDEKRLAQQVGESVLAIMEAKKSQRGPALSDGESSRLESTVAAHEKRIDDLVFRLYGVDGLSE